MRAPREHASVVNSPKENMFVYELLLGEFDMVFVGTEYSIIELSDV